MKTNLLFSIIVITLLASACQASSQASPQSAIRYEMQAVESVNYQPSTTVDQPETHQADLELIRQATVLIHMELPTATGMGLGSGLATLVAYQGENYLVTHNHWGELLQDTTIVGLRNADNHMIQPMYGSEFKNLIVYQDPGTLVLRAPSGLTDVLTPANLVCAAELQVGAVVQLVVLDTPIWGKAAVHDAAVEETRTYKGEPIFKLHRLDNQPIHPGDSGGGVWYAGKLIANNWVVLATYTEEDASGNPADEVLTDLSYAAILPSDFR
jgi:hypothetical protein